MKELLLPVPLRGNPATHVLGAVDDSNPGGFDSREKPHRSPIRDGDILKIEGDSIVGLVRDRLLQPDYMFNVHLSAQSEHDRVRYCRAMNYIGQLRSPHAHQ